MSWSFKFWSSSPSDSVTWTWSPNGLQPFDVSSGEIATITAALNALASQSTLVTDRLNSYGQDIRVGYRPDDYGHAMVSTPDQYITIDTSAASSIYFFNSFGELVQANLGLTLMHELAHIYLSVGDPYSDVPGNMPSESVLNSANYDARSDIIDEQNELAESAGLTNQIQVSYWATVLSSDSDFLTSWNVNSSYSGGHQIGNARIGTPGDDHIDHSNNTYRIDDLIFGKGGNDEIRSGIGNDYVYGGDGDDKIWGGDYDDELVGEDGDDFFYNEDGNDQIWGGDKYSLNNGVSDGFDVADYSSASSPIAITFDGDSQGAFVRDGTGDTDALHSIEKIIGTSGRDYLRISGEIALGTDLLVDASGGQGPDPAATINGDESATSLEIWIDSGTSGVGYVRNAAGGQIDLAGFQTNVIGSDYGDTITDDSDGRKRINGGGGNDTISTSGTSSNTTIYGGDGSDTITGGSGNDFIIGNASLEDAWYYPQSYHDIMKGGAGHDHIVSTNSYDDVEGGNGDDYIEFLYGAGGYVLGGEGNDIIAAGAGSQIEILFSVGDGHDGLAGDDVDAAYIDIDLGFSPSSEEITILIDGEPNSNGEFSGIAAAAIIFESTGESFYIPARYVEASSRQPGISPPLIDFGQLQINGLFEGVMWDVSYGSVSSYEPDLSSYQDGVEPPPEDVNGTAGDDDLAGGPGDDAVSAGDGDDWIDSSGGDDQIDGGTGQDVVSVFGARSNFLVSAGVNSFTLTDETGLEGQLTLTGVERVFYVTDALTDYFGSNAADTIIGSSQDNHIYGLQGGDTIDGGAGIDTVFYSSSGIDYAFRVADGTVVIAAADPESVGGIDQLVNVEQILYDDDLWAIEVGDLPLGLLGTSGSDALAGTEASETLLGLEGADSLIGGAGSDYLFGGTDADVMSGGEGDDTYQVDDANDIVIESIGEGFDYVEARISYTLGDNVEGLSLLGSSAGIDGTGNALDNDIYGDNFDNTLQGLDGNDWLDGYGGVDVLIGGNGADTFAIFSAVDGVNFASIVDFVSGVDKLILGSSYFDTITVEAEELPSDAFTIGQSALDADDRIIYDDQTGILYYDADGNASGTAIAFASLQPHTTLALSDFAIW